MVTTNINREHAETVSNGRLTLVEGGANWVLSLRNPAALDPSLTGNKGANLARLSSLGLPVPDGFVILTEAYRRHVGEGSRSTVKTTKEITPECIRHRELDESLTAQILKAYNGLDRARHFGVAVRSSALGEDSEAASCAGQYETILNVSTDDELIDAVRECWASAWSKRVLEYRRQMNLPPNGVGLAVVVQLQIDSRASGILFTRSPNSARTDRMLLCSSYGLGDTVVQGLVTPDEFEVHREALTIESRKLGDKASKTIRAEHGTTIVSVPQEDALKYSISDECVIAMARYGVAIEAAYSQPQDIEWAFADDQIYLLQTRPITRSRSSRPDPNNASNAPQTLNAAVVQDRFIARWKSHFADHFPDPLTPMDLSTTVKSAVIGISASLEQFGAKLPPVDELICWQSSGEVQLRPRRPEPSLAMFFVPIRLWRMLHLDFKTEWRQSDKPFLDQHTKVASEELPNWNDQQLLEFALHLTKAGQNLTVRRFGNYFLPGLVHERIVMLCLVPYTGPMQRRKTLASLLKGIPHQTAQVNRAIRALASTASANREICDCLTSLSPAGALRKVAEIEVNSAFHQQWEEFMTLYGGRCSKGMIPVPSYPTWRDCPEIVIGMVQSLLRNQKGGEPETEWRDEAEFTKNLVVERLCADLPGGRLLSRAFQWSLKQTRAFIEVREESLYLGERLVAESRRILAEVGRRLCARGITASESDVMFLRAEELAPALSGVVSSPRLATLVAARRRQHADWERANRSGSDWISLALGEGGRAAPVEVSPESSVITGLAASAGKARGKVRVVMEQADLWKVNSGDILVCPATSPAWTAVFGMTAGIVTDIGGVLSHAAIVAREYQIPAVLGTKEATRRLHDGAEVIVDGDSGRVTLVGE